MKDNKNNLRNVRVLKKNMLFVQTYDEQLGSGPLTKTQTYDCCGKVQSLKAKQNYKNWTTYVTYNDSRCAALALVGLFHVDSRIRVLFGTVQYCKYFIRKAECRNEYCVFLHVRDRKNEIIVNDEIQQSVYDQHYDMAIKLVEQANFDSLKRVISQNPSLNNLITRGVKMALEQFGFTTVVEKKAAPPIKEDAKETEKVKEKEKKQETVSQQNNNSRVFSYGDLIKIRLIKKLIRETSSKIHEQGGNQEQITTRSKMMLYQIVKQ